MAREHEVTALVSNPARIRAKHGLTLLNSDALDTSALSAQLVGHDAVISAFSGHARDDIYGYYMRGIRSIIEATKAAGVARLLVVGGAGSLEIKPGELLIDSPAFPAKWRATAEGAPGCPVVTAQGARSNGRSSARPPQFTLAPGPAVPRRRR